VAESDLAYSKLLEINNNLDPEDYGNGVYINMPEVIRGRERINQNRGKERIEMEYEKEIQAYRDDAIKMNEEKNKI
jgi:hypothetical protein